MIRCLLVVCAEGVTIDRRSNSVSVFNIIEEVRVPTFPIVIPKISVLVHTERDVDQDPNEVKIELAISVDDEPVFSHMGAVEYDGRRANRLVLQLGGFAIHQPGLVKIAVKHDGRELGFWPIYAEAVGRPAVIEQEQG